MRLFVALLALLTFLNATTVYGEIYDPETFEPLNNTVVKAAGTVTVQVVADGSYSLELEPGDYVLYAYHLEDGKPKYYSKDGLSVGGEEMRFDIVPMPTEFQQVQDLELDIPDMPEKEKKEQAAATDPAFFLVVVILIAAAILFIYKNKKTGKETAEEPKRPESGVETEINAGTGMKRQTVLDDDAKKVLGMISANEGRIIQKELRGILKWSETKMSLVVAELEASGMIKRIKKGRENILKLIERKGGLI